MASLSKAALLDSVAAAAGVSKGDAERVLDAFFATVVSTAKNGDKVGWPGFGTFATSQRSARTGRNPQTGEAVQIAASTGLKFSASSALKQELNTTNQGGAQ